MTPARFRSGWFCDILALPSTLAMTSSTPTMPRSCDCVYASGASVTCHGSGSAGLMAVGQLGDQVEHPVGIVVDDQAAVDIEDFVVPRGNDLAGLGLRRIEAGRDIGVGAGEDRHRLGTVGVPVRVGPRDVADERVAGLVVDQRQRCDQQTRWVMADQLREVRRRERRCGLLVGQRELARYVHRVPA